MNKTRLLCDKYSDKLQMHEYHIQHEKSKPFYGTYWLTTDVEYFATHAAAIKWYQKNKDLPKVICE